MTHEELLTAVNASAITAVELTSLLQLSKVQMEITVKQNQMRRIQEQSQADAQAAQAQIQALQSEIMDLQAVIQGNVRPL